MYYREMANHNGQGKPVGKHPPKAAAELLEHAVLDQRDRLGRCVWGMLAPSHEAMGRSSSKLPVQFPGLVVAKRLVVS